MDIQCFPTRRSGAAPVELPPHRGQGRDTPGPTWKFGEVFTVDGKKNYSKDELVALYLSIPIEKRRVVDAVMKAMRASETRRSVAR